MQFRAIALAFAVLSLISAVAAPADAMGPAVPILVYHRFDLTTPDAMTVTTRVFGDQLAWLAARKITVIPLHALVDRLRDNAPLPHSAVVLTVDDGHRSVYTQMFPLIRRFRVPITLFIYPSAISNAAYALTWDEIREMLRSGLVTVQSHTYWHPNFADERAKLSPPDYQHFASQQLAMSKARLERELGIKVDLLAWPFGIYDRELERLATQTGYVAAFTIERKPVQPGEDLLALPRFIVTNNDRGARFAALVLGKGGEQPP